ncbi:unnamed protein product [Ostreobium quekettii]|uniref:Mannosyltransferase n=1 Tax=Ostreobium quekettii TaxID=121088 RepID=A0A8S1J4I5_9CHLO|nr:unnamed protein product [Ostreobium quekettii]
MFYGRWVLPPWEFVNINLLQGVAPLYGSHPWHWYFTQGLPAMCGTFMVLLPLGIFWSKRRSLSALAAWNILVLSFSAHKEFRYILPSLCLIMPYCGLAMSTLSLKLNKAPREEIPGVKQRHGAVGALQSNRLQTGTLRDRAQKALNVSSPPAPVCKGQWIKLRRCQRGLWCLVLLAAFGVQVPAALYFSLVHQSVDERIGH